METFKLEPVTKDTILCNISELNRLKAATYEALTEDRDALDYIIDFLKTGERDSCPDELAAVYVTLTDPLVLDYYQDWVEGFSERFEALGTFLVDTETWVCEYNASEECLGELEYIAKECFPNCQWQIDKRIDDMLYRNIKSKNIAKLSRSEISAAIIAELETEIDNGLDLNICHNQYGSAPDSFFVVDSYAPGECEEQIEVSRVIEAIPGITIEELAILLPLYERDYCLRHIEKKDLERQHGCFYMYVIVEAVASYGLEEERANRMMFRAVKRALKAAKAEKAKAEATKGE